jgi:pyocin large subunit-like protein
MLRRRSLFLLIVASVVCAHLASATTIEQAKTRVWAIDVVAQSFIGRSEQLKKESPKENRYAYGETASGNTLAAEGLEASSATNAALLRKQLISEEIAGGHAFEKHVIQQAEFSGITTRGQFASEIDNFLSSPSTITRNLSNGRTAFWNETTGTVLIRNPAAADGGTFFRPTNGIDYFWGLK